MLKRKIVEVNPIRIHNNMSPIKFQRTNSNNISPGKSPIRSRSPIRITSPFRPTNDYRSTSPIKFVKNQCMKRISTCLATKKSQYNQQATQQNYFKRHQKYNKIQHQPQSYKIKPLAYDKINNDKFISQEKGKLFSKLVQKLNSDKKQQCYKVTFKKSQNEVCQFETQKDQNKSITKMQKKNSNNSHQVIENVQFIESKKYQKPSNDLEKAKQLDKNLNQFNSQGSQSFNNKKYHQSILAQNISNNSLRGIKNKIVKKQSQDQNANIYQMDSIKMKAIEKSMQDSSQYFQEYQDINMYLMKIKESDKSDLKSKNQVKKEYIDWNSNPVNMSLNMNPFL